MMQKMLKFGLAGLILVGVFAWGVAVPVYKIFPWDLVRNTKKLILNEPTAFVNPDAIKAGKVDGWLSAPAENVMLGDSITAAGRWQEYFPGVSVANRGVGGDTITAMEMRLDNIFQLKPKKVFVHIGINDIYGLNSNDYIIEKYGEIASRFSKEKVPLVIQSTLPCSGETCDEEKLVQISALNIRLQKLAGSFGFEFIDLTAEMAPDGYLKNEYTTDGMHLSGAGFRKWSELISPLLVR